LNDRTTGMTTDISADDLVILRELERKVLWLASWTIHHAIIFARVSTA